MPVARRDSFIASYIFHIDAFPNDHINRLLGEKHLEGDQVLPKSYQSR